MNRQIGGIYTLLLIIFYILFPPKILSQNYENRLYGKEENGKRYYVNIYNERITDAIYDNNWSGGYEYNDTGWITVRRNGLRGIIDIQGNELLPCIYEEINSVRNTTTDEILFHVEKDNMCGIISLSGKIIIPFKKYDAIYNYCLDNNTMFVKKNGVWGGININTGNETIPFKYINIHNIFPELKLIFAESENGSGYIDFEGKIIIPLIHSEGYYFDDEKSPFSVLKYKNDWYVYAPNGERKKLGVYDKVSRSYEGMILVKKFGYYGYCSSQTGKNIIPCIYDEAHHFYDGVALVSKDGADGVALINKKGEILTDFAYSTVHSNYYVKNGFLNTYNIRNRKCGSINKLGEIVIPFKYEELHSFNKVGIAQFKENGKWGLIDKNNNVIIQAKYDNIRYSEASNLIAAKIDGNWGYIDLNDQIIYPFSLDDAYAFPEDEMFASIYINNKEGYIDRNGYIISPGDDASYRRDQYIFANTPSDVDTNIPVNIDNLEQTFAVIIANEKYTETDIPDVPYASNDGAIFKEYCRKTLGIPSANIKYRENATLNQIRYELNWLKDIAEAYNGDAKVIFYYAGHGIPDESNSSTYLLPSDGFGSDINSAYGIDELYSQLGELPAKQITVFIDACFSGAKRDGDMLTSARSVAIKAKSGTPKGNMVVFSAAQGDETAYQYNKKKHGMFTYFLLKKLQETKGNATLGELETYVKQNVQQYSIRENNRKQTPTMLVSPELKEHISKLQIK